MSNLVHNHSAVIEFGKSTIDRQARTSLYHGPDSNSTNCLNNVLYNSFPIRISRARPNSRSRIAFRCHVSWVSPRCLSISSRRVSPSFFLNLVVDYRPQSKWESILIINGWIHRGEGTASFYSGQPINKCKEIMEWENQRFAAVMG